MVDTCYESYFIHLSQNEGDNSIPSISKHPTGSFFFLAFLSRVAIAIVRKIINCLSRSKVNKLPNRD